MRAFLASRGSLRAVSTLLAALALAAGLIAPLQAQEAQQAPEPQDLLQPAPSTLGEPIQLAPPTALLPQAGVALGMALVAAQHLPHVGAAILPVVVAATVVFELVGPVATRAALDRTSGR